MFAQRHALAQHRPRGRKNSLQATHAKTPKNTIYSCMRHPPRDADIFIHMVEAANYVLHFAEGANFESFHTNPMRRFAIIKNIEIIGEAAYMLTQEFRDSHPEVPWKAIINMSHVLARLLPSERRDGVGHSRRIHSPAEKADRKHHSHTMLPLHVERLWKTCGKKALFHKPASKRGKTRQAVWKEKPLQPHISTPAG